MGLHIKQYNDSWNVRLNEDWQTNTIEEAIELSKYLMQREIKFSIEYSFELIHIKFDSGLFSTINYTMFQEVLMELLAYKKKYGAWKR